jgi:hypothetical protein
MHCRNRCSSCYSSSLRHLFSWPTTPSIRLVFLFVWVAFLPIYSDTIYCGLPIGYSCESSGDIGDVDLYVNNHEIHLKLWQVATFMLPIIWNVNAVDFSAILTIVFVMFVAVLSSVLAVGIVQNIILRDTKNEITRGFAQMNKKIDETKPPCK